MTVLKELQQLIRLQRVIFYRRFSSSSTGPRFSSATNTKLEQIDKNVTNEEVSTSSADTGQPKNPCVGRIVYNTYLHLIDDNPKGFRQHLRQKKELPHLKDEELIQAHENAIP